jgi:hypothetical protein
LVAEATAVEVAGQVPQWTFRFWVVWPADEVAVRDQHHDAERIEQERHGL